MTVPMDMHAMMHMAQPAALEETAACFAEFDAVEAETTIDALVAGAVAAWRLEEATYWQRVKLRARLIRTTRRNEAGCMPAEAKSLPSAGKVARVTDEPA